MITCNEAREAVDLHFGLEELPIDLQTHLDECESCRAYHDEMTVFADSLGSDTDIPFSAEELDQAVSDVVERIDNQPTVVSVISPVANWLRPMLRIAAVLMVVGLSYSSYQLGLESSLGVGTDMLQLADAADDRLNVLLDYDTDSEMDEGLIGILIDDYCADGAYEATASLLDDISAEELEYLTENLQVGELL